VGKIEFVGLESGVYVSCDYDDIVGSNYTWYFDHLFSVTIRGIHFKNCPRPLRLDTVSNVTIQNCSFRYFTEAALDIFNCQDVLFNHTVIEHNNGTGIDTTVSYRGNSGGVAFGYNIPENTIKLSRLRVFNSVFRNNTAIAVSSFQTSSQIIADYIFSGRGGSMAVYSNASHHNIRVHITDCKYRITLQSLMEEVCTLSLQKKLMRSIYSHNDIIIERTQFAGNSAGFGGGGIALLYPELKIIDCNFTNNSASAGGGIFISNIISYTGSPVNYVQIKNTLFSNNQGTRARDGRLDHGAAITLSTQYLLDPLSTRYHEIANCTFQHNTGSDGVINVRLFSCELYWIKHLSWKQWQFT
jgi:hypothetical protein